MTGLTDTRSIPTLATRGPNMPRIYLTDRLHLLRPTVPTHTASTWLDYPTRLHLLFSSDRSGADRLDTTRSVGHSRCTPRRYLGWRAQSRPRQSGA